MLIIDAQVHIWGSGKPSGHHRQTSLYTAQELILEMGQAGVDGAVLHPPSWDPNSNEMAIDAAVQYPDKFCALAGSRSTIHRNATASRPGSSSQAWSACAGR